MGADAVRAELVAAAAAGVAADRDHAAGAQLDLLVPASVGRLLTPEEARSEGEARRGRGRPKGSENRSTRELRQFLLGRGVFPQQWLAEWGSLEPEELASRLGCSRLEAFDRIKGMQAELAPYFMPKMAPTDETGAPVPMIHFSIGAESAGGAAVPPWLRRYGEAIQAGAEAEGRIVENQGLSDPAGEPSKRSPVETEE